MYEPMKWQVLVTTAPRTEPTLSKCILSLRDCGWNHEIVVFSEPESDLSNISVTKVVRNKEKLGVWRNWVQSVRYGLATDADVIMTVQDDSLFHPDCKDLSESIMWPREDCGFISLYTPKHYTIRDKRLLRNLRKKDPNTPQLRPVGVNRIQTRSLWGACALIWPRKVLEHIINDPIITTWVGAPVKSRDPAVISKRKDNPHLIANSDTAIGKILNKHNYSMWFVDPSPVQHIARFSAIGHGGNKGRRNAYRIADHSLPLRYQVFPQ